MGTDHAALSIRCGVWLPQQRRMRRTCPSASNAPQYCSPMPPRRRHPHRLSFAEVCVLKSAACASPKLGPRLSLESMGHRGPAGMTINATIEFCMRTRDKLQLSGRVNVASTGMTYHAIEQKGFRRESDSAHPGRRLHGVRFTCELSCSSLSTGADSNP